MFWVFPQTVPMGRISICSQAEAEVGLRFVHAVNHECAVDTLGGVLTAV